MKSISINLRSTNFKSVLLDIFALLFIYFIPSLSHLTQLPIYFIEPIRLMLILSLVHGNKVNTYLLALSLPLFSFAVSGHPALPKMFLVAFELSLNVFLFYSLKKVLKSVFPAILASILASKAIYYLIKFLLINSAVINSDLVSTPVIIQAATTIAYSTYLWLALKSKTIS